MDLSSDRLEAVLEDGEFVLYRSGGAANTTPARSALVLMPRSEHPRPQAIRMLESEYPLRDETEGVRPERLMTLTWASRRYSPARCIRRWPRFHPPYFIVDYDSAQAV